jgi:hypothetical protein
MSVVFSPIGNDLMTSPIESVPPHYIYTVAAGLLLLVAWGIRYAGNKVWSALTKSFETLEYIKSIQGIAADNHLTHIEQNTADMKQSMQELNGKFDVLISVIEKRL